MSLSRAVDIGKLYNGNSLLNYSPAPKGWSHIDVLVSSEPRMSLPKAHISDRGQSLTHTSMCTTPS